jgi:hypothetical protein
MNRFAMTAAAGGASSAIVGFTTGYFSVSTYFGDLERTLVTRLSGTSRSNGSTSSTSASTSSGRRRFGNTGDAAAEVFGASDGSTGASSAPPASTMAWAPETLSHAIAVDLCERIANENAAAGGAAPRITVLHNDGQLRQFVQLMIGRQWKSGQVHLANPSNSDWALRTILGLLIATDGDADEAARTGAPGPEEGAAPIAPAEAWGGVASVRKLLQEKLLPSPGVAELVLEATLARASSKRLRPSEQPVLFVHDRGGGAGGGVDGEPAGAGGLHASLQAFLARLPNAVRSLARSLVRSFVRPLDGLMDRSVDRSAE